MSAAVLVVATCGRPAVPSAESEGVSVGHPLPALALERDGESVVVRWQGARQGDLLVIAVDAVPGRAASSQADVVKPRELVLVKPVRASGSERLPLRPDAAADYLVAEELSIDALLTTRVEILHLGGDPSRMGGERVLAVVPATGDDLPVHSVLIRPGAPDPRVQAAFPGVERWSPQDARVRRWDLQIDPADVRASQRLLVSDPHRDG